MPFVQVINKETHQATELNLNAMNSITLQNPSVIKINVDPKDVNKLLIQNQDLVIQLQNGDLLIIKDYAAMDNSLVFAGNNGQLYWVQFSDANAAVVTSQQTMIDDLDTLLYTDTHATSGVWGVAAAVALGAAVMSNDGEHSSPTVSESTVDTSSTTEPSTSTVSTESILATVAQQQYIGSTHSQSGSAESQSGASATLDIVDYQLAGDTAISVDLSNPAAQDTGFGTASFEGIEGIAGASGNDKFTSNAQDNYFEGRGGDDSFYLNAGGQVNLIYHLLDDTDATGGNGTDSVYGFSLGSVDSSADADVIDLADLLIGYTAGAEPAAYQNGIATLASDAQIRNYLNVDASGDDAVISIDRDGSGSQYGFEQIAVLKDTDTSLEQLLANHQIIIG